MEARERPTGCVFIATSVDGYIARRDGSIDWLDAVERKGEDYGFQPFFDSVDALVLGRNTYDFVRGMKTWPYAGKRCVVLTRRPTEPMADETFTDEAPPALMARLHRDGVKRVYVDGGAVITQFLAAGLIDELTISQIPVLLGDGVRLFGPGVEQWLELVSCQRFSSGLTQSTWRRADAPSVAPPTR